MDNLDQKIRLDLDLASAQADAKAFIVTLDKMHVATKSLDTATYAFADAEGKAEASSLEYALAAEKVQAVTVDEQVSLAKIAAEMGHVTSTYQVNTAAAGANAAAAVKVAKTAEQARTASIQYRERIQGLGYAINDFTSVSGDMSQRLNAIANNMPMLLAGFGGLGLALSAILPIVGIVIKNWDTLKEAFGGTVDHGVSKIDQLKAKIKELEDKPVKIAVDDFELQRAKAEVDAITSAVSAFEAWRKAQSAKHTRERERRGSW